MRSRTPTSDSCSLKPSLPQNVQAQHEIIHSPFSDLSTEVPSEYSDGGSLRAEAFRLPTQSEDDGYYGILWHAFYMDDGIRTEARIINKGFALLLAQELSRYYQTEVEVQVRKLQSWVEFGRLRRMFCWWIDKSRMNKDSKIYQAVKQCEEETTMHGNVLLEDYESRLKGDKAGDPMIARLRTDLFLDLCIGKELDVLIDGNGMVNKHGQLARSRLVWWIKIDDQSAILTIRGAAEAVLNQERSLTVNITGDIISKLRSQGIFFHGTTLTSFIVAGQSREDATAKTSSKRTKKTSKRHSVDQIATSSNQGKAKRKHKSKVWKERKSQGKIPVRTKPRKKQ
jgi:hypothetical protein